MPLRMWCARLLAMFRKGRRDGDLNDEIRAHLDLLAEDHVRRGMSFAEARAASMREFGGVEQMKETYRDRRGLPWVETAAQDVRYAARIFRKAPGFSAVCVLVLAIGIGATTAMFSLVDAALIRPLSFPEAERLVMLWEHPVSGNQGTRAAPLNFLDWSEQNRSFDAMAAGTTAVLGPLIDPGGSPETVGAQAVTPRYFDVFGVAPILGRTFVAGDDSPNATVAVISERLWRRRFGGDPGLVGRTIRVGANAQSFSVIGIVPGDFEVLGRPEVWTLISIERRPDQRRSRFLQVVGRLKRGVTIDQARADIAGIEANIARVSPDTNKGWVTSVVPLHEAIVGRDLRLTTLALSGVVAFVLLLTCANVANLLVTRGVGRGREMAVRAALGGSRLRIARQLLTESVILGGLGGIAGLALTAAILRAAPSFIPPRMIPDQLVLALDWRLGLFALLLTFVTAVLFGIAPAWQALRVPLAEAMGAGGRSVTDRTGRLRASLAVIEIASALLLMTGAGLLLRTVMSLNRVDAGYRADRVLTMVIGTSINQYRTQDELAGFYQQIEEGISHIPGVRAVGFTTNVPLDGDDMGQSFEVVGQPSDPGRRLSAHYQIISPTYFEALGIELLRGRAFTAADASGGNPVCIVNEEFVRRHLGGRDPIGAYVRVRPIALRPTGPPTIREIVGVIRQVKVRPGELENAVQVYVPLAQNPWYYTTLAVRTAGDPMALLPAIKSAVARIEPYQVLLRVRTMEDVAAESVARPRFRAQLVGVFAVLAVVLAGVGVFSVVMFSVQQRAREFSIRMTMGARPVDLLRLVLGSGLKLVAMGSVVGIGAAAGLVRLLESLLFGVQALDPFTFVSAPVLFAAIALIACAVPAIQATRSDPAVALRQL